METIKPILKKIGGWEYTWGCFLIVATLALHLAAINQPNTPIFDEQHYVLDARSILQGSGTLRFEHPPLGRLFIVFGIFIFGDNPFGWRFFSVMFGTATIFIFYLICRQLQMSKLASSLATFLLAFENLNFVQAGIAMIDVFSLTFIFLSFWLYLKGRYPLASLFVGLGTLAKLSGALALFAIALHWLTFRRDRCWQFIGSMCLAPFFFLSLLPLLELPIFREFTNPFEHINTMLRLSHSLTFEAVAHISKTRPWDWLIGKGTICYWYQPNYYALISHTVLLLTIPSVIYLLFRAIQYSSTGLFGVCWFFSTYILWIPITIFTNRVSYLYYFYPTVGAICIGLALGFSQLIEFWQKKKGGKLRWIALLAVVGYSLLHIAIFATFSPISLWFVR